jgi:plasmid stability protein
MALYTTPLAAPAAEETAPGDDFFPNDYSKGSGNKGCMFGAYLRSPVGQTGLGNNCTVLFAPGPKGPITSVRFENAREGNQESEARIVIEKALQDETNPVPADLAATCRSLFDYRTNIMRMWHIVEKDWGTRAQSSITTAGWIEKDRQLFDLAHKVEQVTAK